MISIQSRRGDAIWSRRKGPPRLVPTCSRRATPLASKPVLFELFRAMVLHDLAQVPKCDVAVDAAGGERLAVGAEGHDLETEYAFLHRGRHFLSAEVPEM